MGGQPACPSHLASSRGHLTTSLELNPIQQVFLLLTKLRLLVVWLKARELWKQQIASPSKHSKQAFQRRP